MSRDADMAALKAVNDAIATLPTEYAVDCDDIDDEMLLFIKSANGPDYSQLIGQSTCLEDGNHEARALVYVSPEWCEGADDCGHAHEHGAAHMTGYREHFWVTLILTVKDGEVDDVIVKPETVENA
jgi:hypothetical protein